MELFVEDIDENDLDSIELFKNILGTKLDIYEVIETIVHILCVAVRSISVEALVNFQVCL